MVATQIFFIFTTKIGEDDPILTHIFQRGWFNHQSVLRVSKNASLPLFSLGMMSQGANPAEKIYLTTKPPKYTLKEEPNGWNIDRFPGGLVHDEFSTKKTHGRRLVTLTTWVSCQNFPPTKVDDFPVLRIQNLLNHLLKVQE